MKPFPLLGKNLSSPADSSYIIEVAGSGNIGTQSIHELFFQLIGWFGVRLGVSPVGMVYFMG